MLSLAHHPYSPHRLISPKSMALGLALPQSIQCSIFISFLTPYLGFLASLSTQPELNQSSWPLNLCPISVTGAFLCPSPHKASFLFLTHPSVTFAFPTHCPGSGPHIFLSLGYWSSLLNGFFFSVANPCRPSFQNYCCRAGFPNTNSVCLSWPTPLFCWSALLITFLNGALHPYLSEKCHYCTLVLGDSLPGCWILGWNCFPSEFWRSVSPAF